MALLIHILISFASVACVTYLFVFPTRAKLYACYGFASLTIASGSYLVIVNPAHMVQACTAGLIYIGVMAVTISLARNKLSGLENKLN